MREFYDAVLPQLIGETFDVPRGYGHARYKVLGDHSTWKKERDAEKIYFHFDENSHPIIDGNEIGVNSICIAIKRVGGFNGPPKINFKELILWAAIRAAKEEESCKGE